MDATAASVPDANPLRLTACPECGYALEGLPDAAPCPECGHHYDRDDLILFGTARGTLATAANSSGWALAGQLLFLAFFFSNVWVQAVFRSGDPSVRPMDMLCAGLVGLLLLARLSASKRGTVRVRRDAAGVLQENAAPPDALANRLLRLYGSCMPGALLLVWAASPDQADRRLPLVIAGASLVLFAVAFCTVGPLRRGFARVFKMPRPAADSRATGRTPWSAINEVMLGRGYFGRYHLRLRRYHPWRLDREYVNVELNLSDVQAEALRGRIQAWRALGPGVPTASDKPA